MHVLRKQERSFLRTGGTEVEGLTRKWTEILEFAIGIGALDAGDALGVVPAENKLLHHLGDPLDSESAIDDGVFAFVLFSDALKTALEQQLNGVDSTRPVHRLCEVGKRKGGLSMHIEVQRGD